MVRNINIFDLLGVLLNRIWLVLLAAIILASGTFVYLEYFDVSVYSTKISFHVTNRIINESTEGQPTYYSANDYNAVSRLIQTYRGIITSDLVMEKVAYKSCLPYSTSSIKGMMTISALTDTEIMEITVLNSNSKHAYRIAAVLSEIVPGEIIRISKAGSVEQIDIAKEAKSPVSKNKRMNVVFAFIAGAFVIMAIILTKEFLDNRIKGESDLKANFDIPLIGTIPKMDNAVNEGKGF